MWARRAGALPPRDSICGRRTWTRPVESAWILTMPRLCRTRCLRAVTFVTRPRPQLAAQANRIEQLDAPGRRADEPFGPEFREDARNHFSNRPDAVRQILLTHERGERSAWRTRGREIEQMARHALAHRRERIAGQFL